MTNDELAKIFRELTQILKVQTRLNVVMIKIQLEVNQDSFKDKYWHKIDDLVTELDKEIQ